MENIIWKKWEEHYRNLGIDAKTICKDGIVDEEGYKNTKPKILFILKEVNKWPGGDLRVLFREKPYGIGRTIARWTVGVFYKFPGYKEIEKMDDTILMEYLTKVAVINLKKISGDSVSDASLINIYAHQDRQLLQEQIDSISPNVIIACGVMDSLIWLLDLKVDPNKPSENPVKDTTTGVWVIPFRHPSRDNNPRKTYEKLKELIENTQ